jgi:hypothetical protein
MPLRTAIEIGAHAHGLDPKVAALLTRNPFRVTFIVMAGTSPAMTGFVQGGSGDGRCELTMTGKPSLSAFTRLPCATSHLLLIRLGPYALTAPAGIVGSGAVGSSDGYP